MKIQKRIAQIILDILIFLVVSFWAYLLYQDFSSLPGGEQMKFAYFNIKILLFALFLIASVTCVFYFNLLARKNTPNDTFSEFKPDQQDLDLVLKEIKEMRNDLLEKSKNAERTISPNLSLNHTAKSMEKIDSLILSKNFSTLTERLFDITYEFCGAQRVSLFLFRSENQKLMPVKSIGFSLHGEKLNDIGDGIAWQAYKDNKRYFVTNVETHPEINRKNRPQYLKKSFIIYPLHILGDETIGILNLSEKDSEDGVFSKEDLDRMQTVVHIFETIMENAILHNSIEDLLKKA